MSLNHYIVSIDDEKHNIHAITVIYASERERAREIVKHNATEAAIGVYDEFPIILIEDGTNYVLRAWKSLQCELIVINQREKIHALIEELEVEKRKLSVYEKREREIKEEEGAIPQF